MSFIFIIGMPGAGKTHWGKLLANELKLPFTDMDEYIERKEKNSIKNIFEVQGEQAFRNIETDVLQTIINMQVDKGVIACGGGTPVFNDNLSLMKQNGCVVYLKANVELLKKNISLHHVSRPLLDDNSNLNDTLRNLLEQREKVYMQANVTIDIENTTLQDLKNKIEQCINRH